MMIIELGALRDSITRPDGLTGLNPYDQLMS